MIDTYICQIFIKDTQLNILNSCHNMQLYINIDLLIYRESIYLTLSDSKGAWWFAQYKMKCSHLSRCGAFVASSSIFLMIWWYRWESQLVKNPPSRTHFVELKFVRVNCQAMNLASALTSKNKLIISDVLCVIHAILTTFFMQTKKHKFVSEFQFHIFEKRSDNVKWDTGKTNITVKKIQACKTSKSK